MIAGLVETPVAAYSHTISPGKSDIDAKEAVAAGQSIHVAVSLTADLVSQNKVP